MILISVKVLKQYSNSVNLTFWHVTSVYWKCDSSHKFYLSHIGTQHEIDIFQQFTLKTIYTANGIIFFPSVCLSNFAIYTRSYNVSLGSRIIYKNSAPYFSELFEFFEYGFIFKSATFSVSDYMHHISRQHQMNWITFKLLRHSFRICPLNHKKRAFLYSEGMNNI